MATGEGRSTRAPAATSDEFVAELLAHPPVHGLDVLRPVARADQGGVGGMDDDQVVAADGRHQVLGIAGGDQGVSGLAWRIGQYT